MARFDRFKKLERARPDRPGEAPAQSSMRFGRIEHRKDPPAKAPRDLFAPPPEELDAPIEVADEDDRVIEKAKEEKRAWAQSKIDEERQRLAEIAMREEAHEGPLALVMKKSSPLVNLSTPDRIYVGLGSLAVIWLLAVFVGPILWGLAPVVAAVLIGTMFARR